ncbi:MAG: c-type cytochrome [Oculatellaceae cyanobacterium Prado106]|jgi:cytochrome c6|nr:c-type cytochrome [Oculatellaceae cyanobacterium Prado106]
MRKIVALVLTFGLVVMGWVSPAIAGNAESGAKVFAANCAACHMGGGNVVNSAKTLKKADLDQYQMASVEAIKTQITNGKAAMPAFKGRLTDTEIEDVAAYVAEQAEQGW